MASSSSSEPPIIPPGELAVEQAFPKMVIHHYVSTYCQHGLHGRCRLNCKICDAKCLCTCHRRFDSRDD